MREGRPVRLIESHAMPSGFYVAERLCQTYAPSFMCDVSQHAAVNQQPHKPNNIRMLGEQVPIEPTRIIILAISVVVAALTTPHLIAHNKHGHARRQHDGREKVLHLAVTKPFDYGIFCRAFESAVPASVLGAAVAIVLAIVFIVLVVIGDE